MTRSVTGNVDVNLEVAVQLFLDGLHVDILVLDKRCASPSLALEALGIRLRDLNVHDTGIGLVLLNGRHGEPVRVLLAPHEGSSPRETAIDGLGEVDVRGIQIRPVPIPVDGVDRARLEIFGQLDIRLAPELLSGFRAKRLQLIGTSQGNLRPARLVALPVVEVSCAKETASLVTTGTVTVPEKVNVEETLMFFGLGCAVEKDGTRVLGLVWLAEHGGVPILEVNDGDMIASCSLKHREGWIWVQRIFVEKLVANVSLSGVGGKAVHGVVVLEIRSSWEPPSCVAFRQRHGAIGGDAVCSLDP